jgi:hypothetical protein
MALRLVSVVPSRTVTIGTAIVVAAVGLSNCAVRRPDRRDHGILRCPAGAAADLLSANALQCWFDASHGRWRTLSRESHYDVLVVQVEARDLRDADEIARRIVGGERRTFSEILVYTQPEPSAVPSRIRRVRWTPDAGFEALEFTAPPVR